MTKDNSKDVSFEAETTTISCCSCEEKARICGKNGTTISYIHYCPFCGSDRVEVQTEIIDLFHAETDYYGVRQW